MQKTKIEDFGTQPIQVDEPFPNNQKRDQKPWYQCATEGCHYIKVGPQAKYCKLCLHKKHQEGQQKTTLRVIIRLKKREVEE